MPSFMEIGEPTPGRLSTSLSFILEGRAVGFGRFALAVFDGVLHIDVNYPRDQPDDSVANQAVKDAMLDFYSLLRADENFRTTLSALPKSVSLIRSDGKTEVQIASIEQDAIVWV